MSLVESRKSKVERSGASGCAIKADLSSAQQEARKRSRQLAAKRVAGHAYLWLLLVVLYAPILLIFIFSFTQSKVFGNWTGAATIATLLGTLAAIGLFNMKARLRKGITFLNSIPMINPDILTGISLFLLFVFLNISRGFVTVLIAHVVFCTPYVVLSVMPRLMQMNPNMYEAALDLGATPAQALRKILLPELRPGMVSGFILALTLSIDDFGVTFFTKGSNGLETLSTFIYADARKGGLTPELRPLFSLIFLTILVLLIIMNIHTNKQLNKQKK